jgi:hypothetical protein
MAKFEIGDKVRGIGLSSKAEYEGTVVRNEIPLYGAEASVLIKKVVSGYGQPVGTTAFVTDVERIQEMAYVKNLVGPKPEPIQEPKHPTPWRYSGRRILDANGGVVFIVRQASRTESGPVFDIDMSTAYELARVVTDAVNEKFAPAKVQDSPSPF